MFDINCKVTWVKDVGDQKQEHKFIGAFDIKRVIEEFTLTYGFRPEDCLLFEISMIQDLSYMM